MVTRKVSIWIRYKQEGEWVMKRAQWSANRRNLVPGMAKGGRIVAEEYLYYLRYQRDGKRIMEPAGRDSSTGSPPALAISPTFASADFTEAGALKIACFFFGHSGSAPVLGTSCLYACLGITWK
jgi:hypothetical protein